MPRRASDEEIEDILVRTGLAKSPGLSRVASNWEKKNSLGSFKSTFPSSSRQAGAPAFLDIPESGMKIRLAIIFPISFFVNFLIASVLCEKEKGGKIGSRSFIALISVHPAPVSQG